MARVIMLLAAAVVFIACGPLVRACAAEKESQSPVDRMAPVVIGTTDLLPPAKPAETADAKSPSPPKPEIRVDAKTGTVRVPTRPTHSRGVLEWLLAAGGKHPASSAFVTACSAADFSAALARAGLKPGVRPAAVGDDRARRPQGQAVEIDLVAIDAAGKETRMPARSLLSAQAAGEGISGGRWVYVGPQTIRESDVELMVTELSGSLITTNLRDSSAVIYWSPAGDMNAEEYIRAYYASSAALPQGAARFELEIRPAVSAETPSREK